MIRYYQVFLGNTTFDENRARKVGFVSAVFEHAVGRWRLRHLPAVAVGVGQEKDLFAPGMLFRRPAQLDRRFTKRTDGVIRRVDVRNSQPEGASPPARVGVE